MNWLRQLSRQLLKTDPHQVLCRELRRSMGRFTAPTDAKAWAKQIPLLRRQALKQVFLKGYSQKQINVKPPVVWGKTLRPGGPGEPGGPGVNYVVRKLRYEIFPDYWIPALMYVPNKINAKMPVVLNSSGHCPGGKARDSQQARCANLARRGIIALNFEFIGMGELEADALHNQQSLLSLTGLSGVGLFYLAMKKGLDVLLDMPHADPKRVGMTGLSGGGWQTIVLSALDRRITTCIPVAGYTPVRERVDHQRDIGDLEQIPPDLTTVLDYDTMTAMLAPRPTLQITNEADNCCFKTSDVKRFIYDAIKPTYRAFGVADYLAHHNNVDPGTHNYESDNREALYRFLNQHFGMEMPTVDLHTDEEILTEDQTLVGLPLSQTTLGCIAAARATRLAQKHQTPRTALQKKQLRKAVAEVIHLPAFSPRLKKITQQGNVHQWIIKTSPWSVPMTGRFNQANQEIKLVLLPRGRQSYGDYEPLASAGENMFLPDLFGHGENEVDFQHQMLFEASGARVLGVQVAQIMACTEMILKQTKRKKMTLVLMDVELGLAGLIAAALKPSLFDRVIDQRMLIGSLRLIVDWGWSYDRAPGVMCPGLLKVTDIPQLHGLLDGIELIRPGRGVKSVTHESQ